MNLPRLLPVPSSITRSVFCVLLLASVIAHASFAAPTYEQFSARECLARLDSATALVSNESTDLQYVERQFELLELNCGYLPQLAHNQGVLAGRDGRWQAAIRHFKRSLKSDERASMTHDHLQQIFEHRAAQAYAKALKTPIDVAEPQLQLQNSTHTNADAHRPLERSHSLYSISTIEYELFAWWLALQNNRGLREHYARDFHETAIRLSRQANANIQWESMKREIAFTAQDAVVVISDEYRNRTLLLMRLEGNRWKIYQETRL